MSRLQPTRILLIFVLLAIIAQALDLGPVAIFILSFLAVIPLASLVGEATKVLAAHTGPRAGALLNATFGTAVELILLFALLRSGQIAVVKASLVGSILTSLILVVGFSQLLGGLRNGVQRFDKERIGVAAAMMTLAVVGLALPTVLAIAHQAQMGIKIDPNFHDIALDKLSQAIALILLLLLDFKSCTSSASPSLQSMRSRQKSPPIPGDGACAKQQQF